MEEQMEEASLEILPNEALLQIFKHLDASALVKTMGVCRNWYEIANTEILWRRLCFRTNRIIGKYTKEWAHRFTETNSWKNCYAWFTEGDLKTFTDPQEICDTANNFEADALRRRFFFCKGMDTFSDSPIVLQQYADFLSDRPDEHDSWELANQFYKTALSYGEQTQDPKLKKIHLFTLFRFGVFLANNKHQILEADKCYRQLLKKLPGNPWIFEKYAEFLTEFRRKYNLAERIYRIVLNMSPTGTALVSYALFLWQVRRNYALAGKCFRVACELDVNKVYVYVNFLGRQVKDEQLGRDILINSKLYKQVAQGPPDEQKIFSLALAFHQIHKVDEAEELYRRHMNMTDKVNICTLSNLAELLLHSKLNYEESERLYSQGLAMTSGVNDTIEVALGSLKLARGDREQGLEYMYRLVTMSHILASRNAVTEAWLVIYIHTYAERKREALENVKRMIVTEGVRPKLILMFDANLHWAKMNKEPNYEWMKELCSVYNCEEEIEMLNDWEDWTSIKVDPPLVDDDEEELSAILSNETEVELPQVEEQQQEVEN